MNTEITINGIAYVPKSEANNQLAEPLENMPFVLVRTYSAGVHFGYLKRKESTLAGVEVTLVKARRIWYWIGAASISQIAQEGVSNPEHKDLKFAMEVESIDLVSIEIISITEKAKENLKKIAIWKK